MTDEQRAAWLAERGRIKTVGGSTIANILGKGRRTAAQEYRLLRGEDKPEPETLAMRRGRALESLILDEYKAETGRELVALPEPGIIRHPKYPWAAASFDGLTTDGRIVEAKAYDFARGFGQPGTDQVPDDVLLQTQWYLMVAAAFYGRPFPEGDPVVLPAGANKVRIYCVRADPELHEIMLAAGAQFIEAVERGTPPGESAPFQLQVDGVERVAVKADDQTAAHCAELAGIKASLARLGSEEEELAEILKGYMGPATELVDVAGRTLATYRPNKSGGMTIDTKALEKAHPEIVQQFTRPKKAARPLLVK